MAVASEQLQNSIQKAIDDEPSFATGTVSIVINRKGPIFAKKECVEIIGTVRSEREQTKLEEFVKNKAGNRPVENHTRIAAH